MEFGEKIIEELSKRVINALSYIQTRKKGFGNFQVFIHMCTQKTKHRKIIF